MDPVPQVLFAGRTIRLADPLAWYQWLWSSVPLVLVFMGGALGGLLGGITMAMTAIARYALAAVLSVGALGAYLFFATMFLSAVHAK